MGDVPCSHESIAMTTVELLRVKLRTLRAPVGLVADADDRHRKAPIGVSPLRRRRVDRAFTARRHPAARMGESIVEVPGLPSAGEAVGTG